MTTFDFSRTRKSVRPIFLASLYAGLLIAGPTWAQSADRYMIGDNPQLEMNVHIIGEVQRPGEYRVPDNTNVLELFSKAGGPTEYSKLSKVTITRYPHPLFAAGQVTGTNPTPKHVMKVNLQDMLKTEKADAVPILLPGDVVLVPRNSWHTWRNVAAVARDVSVVASVYLIYVRATK